MKNNKLYGAAMLSDEISEISHNVELVKNMLNEIMEEKIPKDSRLLAVSEMKEAVKEINFGVIADAYKDISWKIDIISDYILSAFDKLQELERAANEYYDSGEEFLTDVIAIFDEATRNNGKINTKKLLAVFGKNLALQEDQEA